MTRPKEIAPGQAHMDLTEALSLLEAWKTVVARCRDVADTAYTPALRLVASSLYSLADGAVHALKNVFDDLPHSEPEAPAARVYQAKLPEWRPGGEQANTTD